MSPGCANWRRGSPPTSGCRTSSTSAGPRRCGDATPLPAASPVTATPPRAGTIGRSSIVDAYVGEKQADGSWYDEMLHADRSIRPAWTEVAAGLADLGGTGLRRLRQQVNRMLDDDGVTYNPVDDVRAQPAP